jgi:hypothetical protein
MRNGTGEYRLPATSDLGQLIWKESHVRDGRIEAETTV